MTLHFVHQLDALRRRLLSMINLVLDMVTEACEAVHRQDVPLAERVAARDPDVDTAEVEVESEVIRLLALYQPVGADLRLLCTILKVNNDLERIADSSVNIARRVRYLYGTGVVRNLDLEELGERSQAILRRATDAYLREEVELARSVLVEDQIVDEIHVRVIRQIIDQAMADSGHIAAYLDALTVAKNLERIADLATNIAEDVIFLATGQIVRHGWSAD